MAASRALASKQPNPLINDPFADALVKAVGLDYCNRMADGELESDDPLFSHQRICEQIAVRTRFFDDFFIGAASAGIQQAVILASGLDTRAYRLPWPQEAVVFEIDQPQVIEFKSGLLESLGAHPAAHRRAVPIDLRDDWPEALRDNGFDPTKPTAWIAEGLLIYLPPDSQDLLFDRINELSAPGSRVATEHIPDVTMFSDERSQRITERLKKYGHDIQMSDLIFHGERSHVIEYLTAHG